MTPEDIGRTVAADHYARLEDMTLDDDTDESVLADAVAREIRKEREACAKIVEDSNTQFFFERAPDHIRAAIAAAIRARP